MPPGDRTTTGSSRHERQRILSPEERISEIIFGLIMALSITGSLSVAESGESEVRTMIIGALGCNTAWGIVDALMYLVMLLVDRHRALVLFHAVRREEDPQRVQAMILDWLPPLLAAHTGAPDLERMRLRISEMPEAPKAGLTGRDLLGALSVFLLVFLSTLPVVVPFLLPVEPHRALRLSNAVAVAMLFALGYRLGRYVAGPAIWTGAAAVAVGATLVGMTIALGG
jgi:hypothetical protein